jgi:hypothetical protein
MTQERRVELHERWAILKNRRQRIYLLMVTSTTDKDYQRCMVIERNLRNQEDKLAQALQIELMADYINNSLFLNGKFPTFDL